jgi:DNA-binding response OmpR family regulator
MTGPILVVNRNPQNLFLLNRVLDEAGYATLEAADLDAFDRALAQSEDLILALVDITGFDAEIWERCERLCENGVPLLLVAPRQSATVEEAGERHGARSVLVKPLAVKELVTLVDLLAEA